uniref:Cyclin-A2 n=1 Tax=Vombatus ursinus TaxID=29139 RepID=A0A4X2LBT3_VOMUR
MDMSVLLEPEEKPPNINEVADYHQDICRSLREKEVQYKSRAGDVKRRPDTSRSMRAALVDWLVMAGEEYELQSETLHLAVDYTDRLLSSSLLQGKLQLVGIAALPLASKFEQSHPPRTAELLHISENAYARKDVLRMEQLLLKGLAFDLAAPTIHQFLAQYFLHQQQANSRVESLAMFLGELSLMDADPYLNYLPSITAGAAFHRALYTVTGKSWPESLIQKTGYTLESLKPCLMDLHQTSLRAPQQALWSVQEKYKKAKYQGVSLINPPEILNLQ